MSPTKLTLKQRMKADREGILKRLRTGFRKKVKLDSGPGKQRKIVPVISVEPITDNNNTKQPFKWIE